MTNILCIDDDKSYLKLIKLFLEREGFNVITESNQALTEEILCNTAIDLVVLDVMVPGRNGFNVCRDIKKSFNIPIVLLTALDDDINEITGMDIGADDYIAKPFKHDVFIARIKSHLRKNGNQTSTYPLDDGLDINELQGVLITAKAQVHITPMEAKLIKYMIKNKNQVLPRETLLTHVWGWDYYGDPRTLDTHIKSLRSKTSLLKDRIITVRGTGYCYRRDNI